MESKITKGYKYYFDEDKIREYMKVPASEKLKWLEEVRQFNEMFMTEKAKKIRELLRKGEI